ncbi:MAG: phosphoribosylformylglycinamidine synthase II, partial [Candidatus Aenigmarchaeota archaeon]|nr:phosphoribosylformylglycinamidine synthase II [Candidatus Aenigmarchaeota archaeon]
AEMCFGKENIGADIDVSEISNIRPDFKLFSESNTRWVVEVSPENKELFENIFRDNKIPVYELGTVTRDDTLKISDSKTVIIDTKVSLLRREWVNGLNL